MQETESAVAGIIDVGKKIANFNIISHPHTWDNLGKACNGSRIFFSADATPWTVEWDFVPNLNPDFNILDCNGTGILDKLAVIQQSAGVPVYIFIRVEGPKTSTLGFVCNEVVSTTANPLQTECLVSSTTLSKGKTFTKVTQHVFDTQFSEVLWTLDPSTNFKIAQVDVYAQPS